MSATTLAGLLLIAVPLAVNGAFSLLASRFDDPDVLRHPTAEVLARFRARLEVRGAAHAGCVCRVVGLVGGDRRVSRRVVALNGSIKGGGVDLAAVVAGR